MSQGAVRRLNGGARWLALVWFAGCAEAAVVAPGGTEPARALLEEDDIWAMIPAESDLVLFADLAKLRQSPWTGETFDKVSSSQSATDPAVDQMRTMDRVLFAKVPALHDGASVLVAQGSVDREVMRRGFRRGGEGVERSTYRGAELLVRGDEALGFAGKRTVLSGYTLAVRAAIDCNVGLAAAIESEAWFKHLRGELDRQQPSRTPVASLYVRLQPATRQALLQEMGEGEFLEELGSRIDLGADLDVTAIGVVRTNTQASDLAARLAERIREVRTRPIVAAFGLTSVLDSLRFSAKDNQVHGGLHVSQTERAQISARMTLVAETFAKMRGRQDGKKDGKKNDEPGGQKADSAGPNQDKQNP
jgi:hypothetical protein